MVIVCCALHNFIRMNNRSDELFRIVGESDGEGSVTQRHVLEMSSASKRAMGQFRENITDTMWDDYVACGNVR